MKKIRKTATVFALFMLTTFFFSGCMRVDSDNVMQQAIEKNDYEKESETETEDIMISVSEPEPEPEPEPEIYEVSLCAVGDDLIHSNLIKYGKQSDGTRNYDFFYENVLSEIEPFDVRIINQETVFVDDPEDYSGYPRFGSPKEVGDAVIKAGFNVVTHATNHAYDKGEKGILSTVAYWKEHPEVLMSGMYDCEEDYNNITVGTFNNIRIAFLNYTYSLNGLRLPAGKDYYVNLLSDEEKIVEDLKKAKELADLIVVCPHWGSEYVYKPTDYQKRYAKLFVENGADLIIGAHPHVVEPLEYIETEDGKKVPCFYSLGNFISSQDEVPRMLGAMAKVKISMTEGDERAHIVSAEMEPIVTHLNATATSVTTYMLKDYSEELAAEHRLTKKGKKVTLQGLWDLYNSITGQEDKSRE